MLFCFPGTAFAWSELHGGWFLEGRGDAERGFQRADLDVWGELFVETRLIGGVRYVTGYDVWVTLNAPRFNINSWNYSAGVALWHPIRIPSVPPTRNRPFRLPPITSGGLVYDVEFTSATSGTIWIYGNVGGGVAIDSLNVVWIDKWIDGFWWSSSGCNAGIGVAALLLVAPAFALSLKKRTRKTDI